MRNNGKNLTRLLAAALLALAMTLPLTGCQVEIPGVGTVNISDGTTTGGTGGSTGGGTNGGPIHTSNGGVPVIVIGVPVRYIHSHYGFACVADYKNSIKLAVEIIKRLNDEQIKKF